MEKIMKGPLLAEGRTAEVFAWGKDSVLKLYRDWCPPGWADYEEKVAERLNPLGISAPQFRGRADMDGRAGLLYERVHGKSMLALFPGNLPKIPAFARQLAGLHLEMHARRIDGLGSVKDGLRGAILKAPHLPEQEKLAALSRLDGLPDGNRLCHMDFHPGQVIVTGAGAVVLDWVTLRQGCPAADVARTCLLLRIGRPEGSPLLILLAGLLGRWFGEAYLRHYLSLSDQVTRKDVEAWMLPVTAARLNEKIANETAELLRMVNRRLSQGYKK